MSGRLSEQKVGEMSDGPEALPARGCSGPSIGGLGGECCFQLIGSIQPSEAGGLSPRAQKWVAQTLPLPLDLCLYTGETLKSLFFKRKS
jgi:hypothetical protein